MKANCEGDYVNIDQRNTKCVSDYNVYKEVSNKYTHHLSAHFRLPHSVDFFESLENLSIKF